MVQAQGGYGMRMGGSLLLLGPVLRGAPAFLSGLWAAGARGPALASPAWGSPRQALLWCCAHFHTHTDVSKSKLDLFFQNYEIVKTGKFHSQG